MEQAGATGGWQTLGQMNQPQMGGTTRRGSQMIDAQGNVIGHYDDNNQPVYYNRGGQALPPQAQGQPPQGPVASTSMGMAPSYARLGTGGFWGKFRPQVQQFVNGQLGNRDPTGMSAPQRENPAFTEWLSGHPQFNMGVPGSMQQSLYGQGLLRPAMPSMNNQSGY